MKSESDFICGKTEIYEVSGIAISSLPLSLPYSPSHQEVAAGSIPPGAAANQIISLAFGKVSS